MELWGYGVMVLWSYGVMGLYDYGVMVSRYHGVDDYCDDYCTDVKGLSLYGSKKGFFEVMGNPNPMRLF